MKDSNKIFLTVVFLFAPIVIFLTYIPNISFQALYSLDGLKAFLFTTNQALWSTFFSLFFGILGARGLLGFFNTKYYLTLKSFILAPAFIPPLIMIISATAILEPFSLFRQNQFLLIFFQTVTYSGIVSLALARVFLKESKKLSEWAITHNIKSFSFIYTVLKTLLRKDLITLGAFVFINAWATLSLALLTLKDPRMNLEFYTYEKLNSPHLWGEAGGLILFQMIFVSSIALWAFFYKSDHDSFKKMELPFLIPKKFHIIWPVTFSFLALGGLIKIPSFKTLNQMKELSELIFPAALKSVLLGLGTGIFILLLLRSLAQAYSYVKIRKLIASCSHPSTTLIGLCFLLVMPSSHVLIQWILGLSLLSLPYLYRYRGEILLSKLSKQIEVAKLLGADEKMVFQDIVWPQTRKPFWILSGMGAFWAMGDFAFSSMTSYGEWSLSLIVYSLFSSYQWDEALVACQLLLVLNIMVFLLWQGAGYFFDKKHLL